MANHSLHEIYNPHSRSLSFEYLAIMRDKRNEIIAIDLLIDQFIRFARNDGIKE